MMEGECRVVPLLAPVIRMVVLLLEDMVVGLGFGMKEIVDRKENLVVAGSWYFIYACNG